MTNITPCPVQAMIIECRLNQLDYFKEQYRTLQLKVGTLQRELSSCRAISAKRLNRVAKLEAIIKYRNKKVFKEVGK